MIEYTLDHRHLEAKCFVANTQEEILTRVAELTKAGDVMIESLTFHYIGDVDEHDYSATVLFALI